MGAPYVSVLLEIQGWPEDAGRFLDSLARHTGDRPVEVIAVDRRPNGEPPAPKVDDLITAPGAGFGAACDLALGAAGGDVVVLVDTSLEVTGDLLADLVGALDDPTVALAGPFGLTTADLCDYEERTAGDVAAVQGYCLAARRDDMVAAGGVGEAFAYYRNADIGLSLRLRTLGGAVRRAVATGAEHCVRHIHRAWEATPEAERGALSRHNMGLVHEVFFGRKDLTVP